MIFKTESNLTSALGNLLPFDFWQEQACNPTVPYVVCRCREAHILSHMAPLCYFSSGLSTDL